MQPQVLAATKVLTLTLTLALALALAQTLTTSAGCRQRCWCVDEGATEGRMFCTDGECYTHPSTQWGLCRPNPTDDELPPHTGHPAEEEPIMPTGFHFWTPDELRERPPQSVAVRSCSPRAASVASPLIWRASVGRAQCTMPSCTSTRATR